MKALIVAVSFVLCVGSAAAAPLAPEPVGFDFQGVPLVTMMQATYRNILHRDFVVSPEVLSMDKRVSVSVKALAVADVPAFVDGILAAEGVRAERHEDGIYYLALQEAPASSSGPAPSAGVVVKPGSSGEAPGGVVASKVLEPVEVYRPINRTVDFMVTVLNAAFGPAVARPAGSVVVLSAAKDRLEAVRNLADQLDVAARNVEVSASFVEVTTSDGGSSGLSLVANVLGHRVGAVVGSGSGSLTVTGSAFSLVLDALREDGRFKQVSNSRVVGDEAERVSLSVGDETPTLQGSGRDNAGNAVQNIVYRSSGVILDVLPKVLGSGRLSLLVDGQVSSFTATATGVTGSPTLNKRQVKTAVTVGDGEVLVIGGLEGVNSADTHSGLSFLPRSWSSSVKSSKKSDLVLVLSARVLPAKGS